VAVMASRSKRINANVELVISPVATTTAATLTS
jgi:hypothetical protein